MYDVPRSILRLALRLAVLEHMMLYREKFVSRCKVLSIETPLNIDSIVHDNVYHGGMYHPEIRMRTVPQDHQISTNPRVTGPNMMSLSNTHVQLGPSSLAKVRIP